MKDYAAVAKQKDLDRYRRDPLAYDLVRDDKKVVAVGEGQKKWVSAATKKKSYSMEWAHVLVWLLSPKEGH